MLDNYFGKAFEKLSVFFVVFVLQTFPQNSFSKDSLSTDQIIRDIEKTLLFDKDSRHQINFYKKKRAKKTDYIINSGENEDEFSNPNIDIVVVAPAKNNFDLRKKEKMAYNAALVDQYEVAIELYKQILQEEPNNSYAKFSLAVVYQKLKQFSQAKKIYHKLLKENPEDYDRIIGNLLAVIIEESPRDAVYFLSRLVAQNPKSSYILAQSAVAYDKMKKYDKAISLLEKATIIDPKNLEYKFNLAIIYDKTSQSDKALEMYTEVARHYSDEYSSIPIEQVQERIGYIRSNL